MLNNDEIRQAVDKLLQQYKEYTQTAAKEAELAAQLAKEKLLGTASPELKAQHDEIKQQLQSMGEAMTFASPRVWMTYKFEAYQDEAQPIRTMHDFRMHCSKPGYICTKRFTFLNSHLEKNEKASLANTELYPDSMLLTEVTNSPSITAIESLPEFAAGWNSHEYFKDNGRVAKWENY